MHSYSKDGNMGPGASNDDLERSSSSESRSPAPLESDHEGNDEAFLKKPDGTDWEEQKGKYRRKGLNDLVSLSNFH